MNEPSRATKRDIANALAELYPWMQAFFSKPVREYACFLYDYKGPEFRSETRARSFDKLVTMLRKVGIRCGLSDEEVYGICKDFAAIPVLQTGPHLSLLVEPEAFYSHMLSMLGLSGQGVRSYVSYAVSTVNMVERGRKGPGWVSINHEPVSLFGLSRKQMLPLSLLAGPGRYRFDLGLRSSESEALTTFRRLLPTAEFDRPAHALKTANRSLWPELFGDHFKFLQVDDEDVADLVCDHLSDDGSWLCQRLFGQQAVAAKILEEIDKLANTAWAGWLTRGTDFFWLYENGKRCALRLVDSQLIEPNSGRTAAKFNAIEVGSQMAERRLIPNLVLVFLVLAILPGVRVLGGSRHPIYYPLMRKAIVAALQSAGTDAGLRQQLAEDERPTGWGHRVIECGDEPLERLGERGRAPVFDLLNKFGARDLDHSCGQLISFVSDPLWQEFVLRLKSKAVGSRDVHWAFS